MHFKKLNRQPPMYSIDANEHLQRRIEGMTADLETPEQAQEQTERESLVHRLLDSLPRDYGDILEWKYIDGLSAVITILQPVASKLQFELAQGHIHIDSLVYRTNGEPLAIELESDVPIQAIETTRWLAPNGADVRFNNGSTFAWRSADALELHSGAAYIEMDGDAPFVIETDHGVVRDIGTEFIVETDRNRLVVSVREGRIELSTLTHTIQTDDIEPGLAYVLEVNNDGVMARTETAGSVRWNWIYITPVGYTTRNPVTMLHEIAEDLGKKLVFVGDVEASSTQEALHGDYSEMTPWPALQQVVNVTDTNWSEDNGTITIAFNN